MCCQELCVSIGMNPIRAQIHQTGTHWKNLKAFTVNPREENKSFKSSSLTEELRDKDETHKEALGREKGLDTNRNLCFGTRKPVSRNVGEVQSG